MLAQEIRRLALLSPHLLSDIGLTAEYQPEGLAVPLEARTDGQVSVKVEGRHCSVLISSSRVMLWTR